VTPSSTRRRGGSEHLCAAFTRALRPVPALLLAAAFFSSAAQAQAPSAAAPKTGLGADIKAYITAPAHWRAAQWGKFGAALAAIGAAYQYDNRARAHFVPSTSTGLDTSNRSDLHDALPAAVAFGGTWLAAHLTDSDDGREEAASMFESAALSSVAGYVLKVAAGRSRPDVTTDRGAWHSGGDAFPSLHVTAAFAIGTVLAESGNDRYRWIRRVLGYGIGAGTAYERLDHNAHWFSDTVAGAALGLATAHFVMRRHNPRRFRTAVTASPLRDGVMLRYTVALGP
jgi:membrane-associated phospholipid phosphatase